MIRLYRSHVRHEFDVVNEVHTSKLGRHINLTLTCMVTNGKLGIRVFPANVSKCRFPPSTNCVFETGNMVNTGSTDLQSALLGERSFIDRLTLYIGYDLEIWNHTTQNIVGSLNVGLQLNLNLLYDDRIQLKKQDCKWEPGLFPGLLLETSASDIVLIIFESGNIIATGPSDINRMTTAGDLFYDLHIELYQLGKEYRSTDGVRIIAPPKIAVKKAKKPNQFKVISHTKKREDFRAEMMSTSQTKKGTKRKADRYAASSDSVMEEEGEFK